jgi:hypothetical protein
MASSTRKATPAFTKTSKKVNAIFEELEWEIEQMKSPVEPLDLEKIAEAVKFLGGSTPLGGYDEQSLKKISQVL